MPEQNCDPKRGLPGRWINAVNAILPDTSEQLRALYADMLRRHGVPFTIDLSRPPNRSSYSLERLHAASQAEERLMLDVLFLAVSSPQNGLDSEIRKSLRQRLEKIVSDWPATSYPCERRLFYRMEALYA